jgi:hypothetical protein
LACLASLVFFGQSFVDLHCRVVGGFGATIGNTSINIRVEVWATDPGYHFQRLPAMVPLTGPQCFAALKNSSHKWDS